MTLPGVGRKTANVVLGNAFGVPGITVDTHFGRLARRFGWTEQTDPVKVEHEVGALFPKQDWTMLSHRLIWHGRRRLPRPQAGLRRLPGRPAGARRTATARPTRSGREAGEAPRAGREATASGPLVVRSLLASCASAARRLAVEHRPRTSSTGRRRRHPGAAHAQGEAGIEPCPRSTAPAACPTSPCRASAAAAGEPGPAPGPAGGHPVRPVVRAVSPGAAVLPAAAPPGDGQRSRCSASTTSTPSRRVRFAAGAGAPGVTYPQARRPGAACCAPGSDPRAAEDRVRGPRTEGRRRQDPAITSYASSRRWCASTSASRLRPERPGCGIGS